MYSKNNSLCFDILKTKYDHYMYCLNNKFVGDYICRAIAANILPITTDNYYVLANMSNKTSFANKIKFIVGGISKEDLYKGEFRPLKCIHREFLEEIGLNLDNKKRVLNNKPVYYVTRNNLSTIIILYVANLNLTSSQLQYLFDEHLKSMTEQNNEIELSKILFVKNDKQSIVDFLESNQERLVEYLSDVFNVLMGNLLANNILSYESLNNNM